jgi:putative methyltransferase (TIGR04325 family)
VLPVFARPKHLRRVLDCLRLERVPLIYAFSDGPRSEEESERVEEVRGMLRRIDWTEVHLNERARNAGLGANVMGAVGQVARKHAAFIVWEDDLVCVPGAYAWLCAALRHYATVPQVFSVTAWTHPTITPAGTGAAPYFDGRAESWVWGAYARSWAGMERTALEKMRAAETAGCRPDAYGADLPRMAREERRRNIWAVRWLYHHLEAGGLCLRPPWSMVEHIGFDERASNAELADRWANPSLRAAPPVPARWPDPVENPECPALWRKACAGADGVEHQMVLVSGLVRRAGRRARAALRAVVPGPVRRRLRGLWSWRLFRGDYPDWAAARLASGGYDDGAILARVLSATLEVKAGRAAFERDGVLFSAPEPDLPLMKMLGPIVADAKGCLRVLDFGGSLGSCYWRHRALLPAGEHLRWDVVEQPAFVEAGSRHLADTPLCFFPDVGAACKAGSHDLLLASGVLQYLEQPFAALEEWSRSGIPLVLLNNLPLIEGERDRLRVQHVPPAIYPATYPVWFFARPAFRRRVQAHFEIVAEFASEAQWPVGWTLLQSTGMLLRRRIQP